MESKKTYALIHLGKKVLKRNYETVSAAKFDYPQAVLIELFNPQGIKLAYIK